MSRTVGFSGVWTKHLWPGFVPARRRRAVLATPDRLEPRQVLAVTSQTGFVQANRFSDGAQSDSVLAYDDANNAIVIWQDGILDGSGRGIYARKFTPAGVPLADQYRINATTAGNQQLPQVVKTGTGFAVLWTDSNSEERLVVRRLDTSGAPTGAEINVMGPFTNGTSPTDPRIFALADGGFFVVCTESPGDGIGRFVHGRRFDSAGTQTASFSFQVATHDVNTERLAAVVGPQVTELGYEQTSDGTFLVYWNKISDPFVPDVGQRYGSQVQVQRFTTAGSKIGGISTLLDFTLSDDFDVQRVTPSITALSGGEFLMQWHAPADFAWVARRFNGGFVAQGADTTLIDASESVVGFLIGAARSRVLSNGDIVVGWHQSRSFAPDNTRIRLFSPTLVPKSSVILVTNTLDRAFSPEVFPDGNRGFTLTIGSAANPSNPGEGEADVFFRRYGTNDAPENTAPVMTGGANPFLIAAVGRGLTPELQNGVLVRDLLASGPGGTTFTDADAGALRGVAIYAANDAFGEWQYSTAAHPSAGDWVDFATDVAISMDSALLLAADDTTRVRLVSGLIPHHTGDISQGFLTLGTEVRSALEFVAWDRSDGVAGTRADVNMLLRGGISPFSTATEELDLYFEARLWRSFNKNASLNVYTLEAEFFALTANPAFEDRSTSAWTGFTVFLSALPPALPTAPLFRMYYGVQYNDDGTQTDMGYRYLTTNVAEAFFLEGLGRADLRDDRQGAYFRELGVNGGSGIIGHIATAARPGFSEMTQIYRTDQQNKPTRPGGTLEGSTPTSQRLQEQGDHVYTTNRPFEKSKPGTWRDESPRGFVRELSPGLTSAGAIGESPVAESLLAALPPPVAVETESVRTTAPVSAALIARDVAQPELVASPRSSNLAPAALPLKHVSQSSSRRAGASVPGLKFADLEMATLIDSHFADHSAIERV